MPLRSWLKRWRGIPSRIMTLASELNLQEMLTRERHRIHLIGVAGSGMSGIAALLLELGHDVSGSDKLTLQETGSVQRLGFRFVQQQHADGARDAELVVYSSAVKADNPTLKRARESGMPAV